MCLWTPLFYCSDDDVLSNVDFVSVIEKAK